MAPGRTQPVASPKRPWTPKFPGQGQTPQPPPCQVLVVGATNRVGLLDDALLRPGRFDHIIYMGKPQTRARFQILQVLQRIGWGSA